MKIFFTLVLLIVALVTNAAPTNAPTRIQLHDQYNALQTLAFPATNLTLLTIADKKGSEQIAGWVAPVKKRFGSRVDIRGIADMSDVPWALRSLVRREFRKSQTYPVMLDWTGDVVNAITYEPDKANVLLLDSHGQILKRWSGVANAAGIQNLCTSIEAAFPTQK